MGPGRTELAAVKICDRIRLGAPKPCGGNIMEHRCGVYIGLLMLIGGLVAQGCATFQGIGSSANGPTLSNAQPGHLRLGMDLFVDARPEDERSVIDRSTVRITVPSEEVTTKFLDDLRSSQMLTSVDFPVQSTEDHLIMKGEIRQFYWTFTTNPILFLPIANLSTYLGVPVDYGKGVVDIYVQVIHSKTSQVMAEYDKYSIKTQGYSLSNFKAREPGAILTEALSDASKQLQEAFLADLKEGRFSMASQ
jgi:hypothetical protein